RWIGGWAGGGGRRAGRAWTAGTGDSVEREARGHRIGAVVPRAVETETGARVSRQVAGPGRGTGAPLRAALGCRGVPPLRHLLPGAERPRHGPTRDRITEIGDADVRPEATR